MEVVDAGPFAPPALGIFGAVATAAFEDDPIWASACETGYASHWAAEHDHACTQPVGLCAPDLGPHMPADLAGRHAPRRTAALRPLHHARCPPTPSLGHGAQSLSRIKPSHRTVPDVHR